MPILIGFCLALLCLALPEKIWRRVPVWKRLPLGDTRPSQGEALSWALFQEVRPKVLPTYKFYTDLALRLFEFSREKGAPLQKPILRLRQHLQQDVQFERTLRRELSGGNAQFVLVGCICLMVMGTAQGLLAEKGPGFTPIAVALLIQGLGAFLFHAVSAWAVKRSLNFGQKLLRTLITLEALLPINRASSQVLSLSGAAELIAQKSQALPAESELLSRLHQQTQEWAEKGRPLSQGLPLLIEELEFQLRWRHQGLLRQLAGLKLGILALFYLVPYMGLIFSLAASFLTQS